MKKILGRIILLCATLSGALQAQEIRLDIATSDGNALAEALIGQPFFAQVKITPAVSTYTQPEIDHDQSLHVRPAGFQMQTINGASEITFNYRVYAEKEGTFTLGPARLQTTNHSLISNRVTVNVVQDVQPTAHATQKKTKKEAPKVFLRLHTNKKEVVIGEKINCTLRLYIGHKRVQLRHIGEPDMNQCPTFTIHNKKGPESGTQEIDGVAYEYLEWSWDLYPQEAGSCLIPAYYADYNIQGKKNDLFSMFSSVFNTMSEQKRVYSNGVSLTVKELPKSSMVGQAVGTFKSFKASLDSHAIKQGEGTVFTLELVGDADFDNLELQALNNMPDHLKWYESKKQTTLLPDGIQKKIFEYIVQGTKAGEWQIPQQQFHFFDTATKKYHTLKTNPLMLHVIAVHQKNEQQNTISKNKIDMNESNEEKESLSDIPELAEGPWMAVSERMIPWSLLTMLSILMMGMAAGIILMQKIKAGNLPFASARLYQLRTAHKAITKARKNNNYQALYQAMYQFIANKAALNDDVVIDDYLYQYMVQKEIEPDQIRHWQQFWEHLAEAQFGSSHIKKFTDLFDQAHHWIDFWEKVL